MIFNNRGGVGGGGTSESVGINLPKVKVEINAADRSWSVSEEGTKGKSSISWMISARSSGVLSVNVDGWGRCVIAA